MLIVGGSGFVGRNLAEFFSRSKSVTATYLNSALHPGADPSIIWTRLDARSASEVKSVMDTARPDVVIHAAGNKDVGWCQSHAVDAEAVNGEAVAHVARACQRDGVRMIYLSTDLVFDGQSGGYREQDVPSPATAYGLSKLRGEQWARAECRDVAICRSGGVYGKRSPLLGWLRAELRSGRMVEAYTDVRNTPTYAVNLGEMMEAILRRSRGGVFHTCGSQSVTRFEFFRSFAHGAGFPLGLLVPTAGGTTRDQKMLRPDTSLNVEATRSMLDIPFDSVVSGMHRFMLEGNDL